jgi:hypothetical protein
MGPPASDLAKAAVRSAVEKAKSEGLTALTPPDLFQRARDAAWDEGLMLSDSNVWVALYAWAGHDYYGPLSTLPPDTTLLSLTQSARVAFHETDPYSRFNREERNCVAMLYFALLVNQNVSHFLRAVGSSFPATEGTQIFVEYSYLRDLWFKHNGTDANQVKRAFILDQLGLADQTHLADCDIQTFNAFFSATPSPSSTHIQSPATWSVGRFGSTITDNEEFLKTCKFKWAFRVKPDLVIQPSLDKVLCIEAKWGAGVGRYPSLASEVAEFKRRGLPQCEFMFLVRQPGPASAAHTTVTWKEGVCPQIG